MDPLAGENVVSFEVQAARDSVAGYLRRLGDRVESGEFTCLRQQDVSCGELVCVELPRGLLGRAS